MLAVSEDSLAIHVERAEIKSRKRLRTCLGRSGVEVTAEIAARTFTAFHYRS